MNGSSGKSPSAKGAIFFANAAHFWAHLFMLIYPTAVLVLGHEFDWAYGEMLSLSLPGFILFGIAALPAGWLGDRWSADKMLAIFFVGTGVSAVLTGLADSPWSIGAGLAGIGLFASIYHPVGTAIVVANAANRGRTLGYNGFFGNLGIALAPLITGGLISLFDWRAAFVIPGILCALMGVAFIALRRNGRGAAQAADQPTEPAVARSDAIRGLLIIGLTTLCIGLIAQALMVSLPKVFDLRVTVLAWAGVLGTGGLVTVALAFGGIGQLVGGHLADRFPLKLVYIAMYVMTVPVAIAAATLMELPLVVANGMIIMLLSMSLPAENSLLARYCPVSWRATAYGTKFVLALGVSSFAVPMVGAVYDNTGDFFWMYVVFAALAAVVVTAGLFLPGLDRAAARSVPSPGAAE